MEPPAEPETPTHQRRRCGIAAVVAASLLAGVAFAGLSAFPHSADEYAYLYQARTFLSGRVVNPPAPDAVRFAPMHVVSGADGMYSKYPPGWPAVLALGESVGLGVLINPLLALALLALVGALTARAAGPRTAWVAVALLGTNAFFLFNGAAYYSHPLVALGALVAVAALWQRGERPGTTAVWVGAGALAVCVLTRPQDALLIALALLPFAILVARRAGWRRALAEGGMALAPLVAALVLYAAYNAATTGDPLVFGHQRFAAGDRPELEPLAMATTLGRRSLEYLQFAAVAVFALFAWLPGRDEAEGPATGRLVGLATALAALFWLGYAPYGALDFPPRYGPRYLLPAHAPLLVVAAVGLVRIVRGPRLVAVVGVIAAAQLVQTAVLARGYHTVIEGAAGVYRAADALADAIQPERALVSVNGASGSLPYWDVIRNDLDYEAPVLFARGPIEPGDSRDRLVYVWDGVGGVPLLWTRDPRARVRAVAATEPEALTLRGAGRRGWLLTRGASDCVDGVPGPPGQRPTDWARFGPCSREGELRGAPWPAAAPASGTEAPAHRHYRSFLRVEAAGRYRFHLAAAGDAVLRIGGVPAIRIRNGLPQQVQMAERELAAGVIPVAVSYFRPRSPDHLLFAVVGPDGRPVPRDRFRTLVARPLSAAPAAVPETGPPASAPRPRD
ncbi:MAG: hypothetical protein MJE66_18100 [Proteobacteria bacterium]|nr:hypothetical protein [Pseudomonadota bacterium]